MGWQFPNLDQYVIYFVKEVLRWLGDNQYSIYIIGLILSWLKIQAFKTKNVVDDKILTLLIYFFSFQWIKKIKEPEIKDNKGE